MPTKNNQFYTLTPTLINLDMFLSSNNITVKDSALFGQQYYWRFFTKNLDISHRNEIFKCIYLFQKAWQ